MATAVVSDSGGGLSMQDQYYTAIMNIHLILQDELDLVSVSDRNRIRN